MENLKGRRIRRLEARYGLSDEKAEHLRKREILEADMNKCVEDFERYLGYAVERVNRVDEATILAGLPTQSPLTISTHIVVFRKLGWTDAALAAEQILRTMCHERTSAFVRDIREAKERYERRGLDFPYGQPRLVPSDPDKMFWELWELIDFYTHTDFERP